MPSFIRHPKDFWTGIIFIFFGLAAVIIGRDYAMGSAARMGPAYFPTMLGGLLACIGLIAVIRSLLRPGDAIGRFAVKELALVLSAVILFSVLLHGAGLVIAVIVLVVLSSCASAQFRRVPVLILAISLAVFSVLVFVKLLGLPMAAFGTWFGA